MIRQVFGRIDSDMVLEINTASGSFVIDRGSALWMFTGFVLTFLITRLIVRLIRWGKIPFLNNVSMGETHIHHMVFGIFGMSILGTIFVIFNPSGTFRDIGAFAFGAALSLTFDEFALWLHLDDVYWAEEGRKSVDVIVIAAMILLFFSLGVAPLGVSENDSEWWGLIALVLLVDFVAVVLCALKGKYITALVGAFVGIVGLIGAIRIARPNSRWARKHYANKEGKQELSLKRESQRNRAVAFKDRVYNAIAGGVSNS